MAATPVRHDQLERRADLGIESHTQLTRCAMLPEIGTKVLWSTELHYPLRHHRQLKLVTKNERLFQDVL